MGDRLYGCEDTPLNRAIGRLMLIASVRRARAPGCKFDQICVLEGGEGLDKSTAIRALAGDENFSDQSVLNVSDKEAQEQLEGIWLHELADLTGLKKAEVERVKAFASRQVDRRGPLMAGYVKIGRAAARSGQQRTTTRISPVRPAIGVFGRWRLVTSISLPCGGIAISYGAKLRHSKLPGRQSYLIPSCGCRRGRTGEAPYS